MSNELKLQAYENKKKATWVAYVLYFLFGFIGFHRFYLRRYLSGFIILAFTFASAYLEIMNVPKLSSLLMIIPFIFAVIDLFYIPKMVRVVNTDIALDIGLESLEV